MVKKTKLWRKTLPDKDSSKVAAEVLKEKSRPADFYLEDRTGQKEEAEIYPERFAKQKFPPSKTPAEHFLSKKLPVKRPRADQSEIFDLWEEEGPQAAPAGKTYENAHIPAVIRPHPGQSYRPDSTFHSSILEKVVNEEAVKEQDELKHQETINNYKIIDYDPSPVQSEDESPAQFIQNPPVKVKYLTNTQKNVKKRNQLKEKLKRILAQEKKSQKQFEQIPIMLKQLENLSKKYKSLRAEEKARKKMKIELEASGEIAPRIRMGKFRYKQPETIAALQPSDSLRKIGVKGSSVEERMDSLVRRKMVDLAKPKDPKKVYIKEYVNNERESLILESRLKQSSSQSPGHIPLKPI